MNQTNSEMPISSFTLNELITMAGGEKRPGIMGECIAANSASEMEIFRFPSRLNALIIGVGTEGETSLKHPTHPETQAPRRFISMVEQELKGSETDFSSEIIGGLIAATIYKVGDILTHYLTEHPEVDSPIHNRAEEYFRQFTELLGEHYKHERSVGFYARQLCITPKYLTTLIKRISGKSVSEWIDNYVILEAKTLLKYSNMSVQEIAYYLNFPNQSFFGSYFKRNAGMSPSQYKAKK